MIAALVALILGQPPVFVEDVRDPEDAAARSFRDQLMLRLLEEGYPLVPSAEHASRTLRVQPTDNGMRVEAQGEDRRAFEVATGPVLPLEAVHRAMEALDEVTPRPLTATEPPARFAVHVLDTPAETSAKQVRDVLVHQVLARNGAVVPLEDEPDAILCAESAGDDIALSRGDNLDGCGLAPTVVSVHRDAANTAFDPDGLDRSLDDLMQEPETLDVQPVEPNNTPTLRTELGPSVVTDRPPTNRSRAPAIRIGARTGVYGRISSADAAVGTTMRVGKEPGPGGLLDVLFVPSSATDISVFETSISGGFGWMWTVHPVVALHAQGLFGVQIHRFRQRTQDPGHQVDWTAEIPIGTSLRLAPRLRLDLTVRGGRSGRPREHRIEDVVTWKRSAWRVGASVGISYGWSPR